MQLNIFLYLRFGVVDDDDDVDDVDGVSVDDDVDDGDSDGDDDENIPPAADGAISE